MRALPVLDLGAVTALALLFVDHAGRCQGDSFRFDRLLYGRLARRRVTDWNRLAAIQKPADAHYRQQQHADEDGKQVAVDWDRWRIGFCSFRVVFICRHYDFRSPGSRSGWFSFVVSLQQSNERSDCVDIRSSGFSLPTFGLAALGPPGNSPGPCWKAVRCKDSSIPLNT